MNKSIGKMLKWFAGIVVSILLLIYITLEGVYFYGLRVLPKDTKPTSKVYSQDLIYTQWVAAEGAGEMKITPLSPLSYAIALFGFEYYLENKKYNRKLPSGMRVASLNARELVHREENPDVRKHWHLNNISVTIWITNNWTVEETVNNLLENSYYGHNYTGIEPAAYGYFNKSYEKLDIYEISMLVGIKKAPTYYDPWCNPKRTIARMNYVINNLSQAWPSVYGELSEVKEVPKSLVKNEKECKT